MKNKDVIAQLEEKLTNIDDRLKALEKEQRLIREDILSGIPVERMRQRLLENTQKRKEELQKKIDNEISFEI
jgi:chaperonin cofactor prefoldin